MLALKTYEQTGVYDPNNPNQAIREAYVPGGYASFYFNRMPNESSLKGLGTVPATGFFASLAGWQQMALIGVVGAAAGYFAMARWGGSLRPILQKIPVVGGQFAGIRRRK